MHQVIEQQLLVVTFDQVPVELDAVELRRVWNVEHWSDVEISICFLCLLGLVHTQVVNKQHYLSLSISGSEFVQELNILLTLDRARMYDICFDASIFTDASEQSTGCDLHFLLIHFYVVMLLVPTALDESVVSEDSFICLDELDVVTLTSLQLIVYVFKIIIIKWLSKVYNSLHAIDSLVRDAMSLVNVGDRLWRDPHLRKLSMEDLRSLLQTEVSLEAKSLRIDKIRDVLIFKLRCAMGNSREIAQSHSQSNLQVRENSRLRSSDQLCD